MTVYCEVLDGATGVFGQCMAWVDDISDYTMPTALYPDGPSVVRQQKDWDEPIGDYPRLVYPNTPVSGHILRLEGEGRLSDRRREPRWSGA